VLFCFSKVVILREALFADQGPAYVVRNSLDKPQTGDLKRTYPTHDCLCVSRTILPRYE
jgi:hypothetical protein